MANSISIYNTLKLTEASRNKILYFRILQQISDASAKIK